MQIRHLRVNKTPQLSVKIESGLVVTSQPSLPYRAAIKVKQNHVHWADLLKEEAPIKAD